MASIYCLAPQRTTRSAVAAGERPSRRQPLPPNAAAAPPSRARRRRLLSLAAPLLFLPWRDCDQGGNYSTGKLPRVC